MKTSEKVNISLRKLVGLPNNPRKITQADLNKLCDSIRNNGYWEHPRLPLSLSRARTRIRCWTATSD